VHGIAIPGRHATHLVTVLYAIPGALIGMAIVYAVGATLERGDRQLADGPFGQ
jgi:membrane protein DedA with SNARE-associated domain